MTEMLAQIDAPDTRERKGFNCGIILRDGIVVQAAPIVGYMRRERWTRKRVRDYCQQKGWSVRVICQNRSEC